VANNSGTSISWEQNFELDNCIIIRAQLCFCHPKGPKRSNVHVGGVARGMSGSRRVSRLAVESVFGSMISNEIKSWKTIVSAA
jgi:hypothetical protein